MPETMYCVSRTLFAALCVAANNSDVAVRYGFKEDPNTQELPEYGEASLDRDGYW